MVAASQVDHREVEIIGKTDDRSAQFAVWDVLQAWADIQTPTIWQKDAALITGDQCIFNFIESGLGPIEGSHGSVVVWINLALQRIIQGYFSCRSGALTRHFRGQIHVPSFGERQPNEGNHTGICVMKSATEWLHKPHVIKKLQWLLG
jgi:hypothetical protein